VEYTADYSNSNSLIDEKAKRPHSSTGNRIGW
jgi:hypothetical protein